MLPDTRLIINLDLFHANIKAILSYKEGSFMFVLKGNGYGHGYEVIAKELDEYSTIEFIGVSSPKEALLIKDYTSKKIVILGHSQDIYFDLLSHAKIIPSISTFQEAKKFSKETDVFITVDSGFHRLGKYPSLEYLKEIKSISALPQINVMGIFTHLTLSHTNKDTNQINLFNSFISNLQEIPYKSISDSIGYTRYDTTENLYRIGALMFGLQSTKEKGKINVTPIAQLKTRITRIETLENDDTVFYKNRLILKGTTIATIPIGYADGLFRTMPKKSYCVVNGIKCKYIEIGMDQSLIDVTNSNAKERDDVVIFGDNIITINELSSICKTNKNNIMTMISSRVPRVYYKNGEISNIASYIKGEII